MSVDSVDKLDQLITRCKASKALGSTVNADVAADDKLRSGLSGIKVDPLGIEGFIKDQLVGGFWLGWIELQLVGLMILVPFTENAQPGVEV